MVEVPTRYDITTDERVPVTQEWVDGVVRLGQKLGAAREAARRINETNAPPELCKAVQDFLDAWRPEFERKR